MPEDQNRMNEIKKKTENQAENRVSSDRGKWIKKLVPI